MKFKWLASLRARLIVLVVVCTLPALALVVYTATDNYRIQTRYAHEVSWLAINGVISRYHDLVTAGRNLLPMLAKLPAIRDSVDSCNRALAQMRSQVPLFEYLDVVSLDGDLRCSSQPFAHPVNMADRGWFRQVLATHQFAAEVVSKGKMTPQALLILSAPHFDAHGNLIGMLNAVIPAASLQPSSENLLLAHDVELVAFSRNGTVLMRYPQADGLLNGDQSRSALFRLLVNTTGPSNQTLAGIDGVRRLYALQRFTTGKPGNLVYLASGVDLEFIRQAVWWPLLRDLALLAAIVLFIVACIWLFTSRLIGRNLRPLLGTLQRIGVGELQARTGLAGSAGEFGEIARGVDRMAENLQARITAQHAAEQARDRSERRQVEFMQQAMDGIMIRRSSGELLFVNPAFCRMLGYSEAELLDMKAEELLDDSDPEPGMIMLQSGEKRYCNGRLHHKSGRVVDVEVSAVCLVNDELQLIIRDISGRLEAERRLAGSERQYRELVEQSVLGILVLRPPTQISFVNQALCRMTGYQHDELLQLSLTALVMPEDIGVVRRMQQIREGENFGFQCRLRKPEGNPLLVQISARRLGNNNIQMVINDISARAVAEQRFAEERNFALNALNTLPGIFFVANAQGQLLRWNRRLEDVCGYSMEELRHCSYFDLVPPERRAGFASAFTRVLSGMRTEGEAEIFCRGGARVPYYFVSDRLESQGQACVVGVGVDISERKQAEQRMNKYLEELQQLSARLLAVQEEERRGIARELHDEFGQGLTAALMNLKELTAASGSAAVAGPLRQVSAILTQLTQQVRTLSLNLRPSVLDDLGLLAAVRWYLRERIEPAGLGVRLDADEKLPRLDSVIETTCFRVLQGALTNVLRHAQARQVHVGLHRVDRELRLSVRDDGCGFDVQRARRDAVGGKSLGLLGMEERVRLAGGSCAISSKPGEGTELRVALPAT